MWYFFLVLLGVMVGSFLNAWIWRTREGVSIAKGRSMCPHCKQTLQPNDLIPILSYISLKGRCRYCKKKISLQYPLVEAGTAILFACVAYHYRNAAFVITPVLVRDLIIVSLLIFIFVYDFLYMEIWDQSTTIPAIFLLIASLIFNWHSWQSLLLGVLIGAGFFLLQFILSKGKWIGGGDIRLGFFMGAILGFPGIILALFIAYIVGAFVSVVLISLKKRHLASETPFGTYLALATFVTMFWGNRIIDWYVALIGF